MNPSIATLRLATRVALRLAVLAAAAAALLALAQSPRWALQRIEVVGDLRHVSRAGLRAAIAGRLHGNFFTLRLTEARAALEAVPWVAAATVRRVWPGRLVVSLRERRAVGLWSDGRVLSDAGQLFAANPAEAELDGPQVEFSGPPSYAPEAAARLADFAAALRILPAALAAVTISARASWTLRTQSGQTLELGRDEPPGSLQARLLAIAAHYPAVVARLKGPPAHIDARYTNGFAASGP